MKKEIKIKALGLCSGGLDSILAALVLKQQDIEVHWISFETPFFNADKARKAAHMIDIPLITPDITSTYIELLKDPNCRFGKNMNPCMDCHTLMYKLAGNVMKKKGYDFLFSGEVLGQRPMSQTRSSLNYVEKHSGHAGFILRPLSAKKLNQSIPEKNGWVDREQLLSISGRSRKQQIALARKYGISDYPAPAGGCLLTDKGYSARLKDLMDHQSEFTKNELHLLKHGRHLRLSNQTKIIVGRTQIENERILSLWNPAKDIFLKTKNVPGPIVLIPNGAFQEMILIGAEICAGYSKAKDAFKVKVQLNSYDKKNDFTVSPMPSEQFRQYIIQSK